MSNAALQVAAMRAAFRSCYQQALALDRDLAGNVWLTIRVATDGSVAESRGLAFALPGDFIDCMLARTVIARFDPPEGGSAVIEVPVTFVKQ